MACPHFEPRRPAPGSPAGIPRPLGDLWLGVCRVTASPAPEGLELCNFGYAAGKCERFTPGEADAIRFAVAADAGGRIRLLWCAERDHLPYAHGSVEYDRAGGVFWPRLATALESQARAYLTSYLRRLPSNSP